MLLARTREPVLVGIEPNEPALVVAVLLKLAQASSRVADSEPAVWR